MWAWETVNVYVDAFELTDLKCTWIGEKKKKTYKHRDGHTHIKKVRTVRVALPYLSPSNSETYARVAVEGWCTPCQPLLPLESKALAAHITYLYGPNWQHRTQHSQHIHGTHNSVYVCGWRRTKCNLSHRCTLSMLYTQLQQIRNFVRWKMFQCP